MIDKEKLGELREKIRGAEAVLIGGGAGLSAAAGLLYGGERFTSNFQDFISKYGLTDMYSSGFYPFPTQEEKWAYWSRHIALNRHDPKPGQVYLDLLKIVQGKDYFVLTTNADGQFEKAGFTTGKMFVVQGDYGKLQCATPCHDRLYDNEELVREMVLRQVDCRIPSELVPRCPRCGGVMEPNLRKDGSFVEDDVWHRSNGRYQDFLGTLEGRSVVLFEIGVGYNTPTIIKFSFERITAAHADATLVRINRDHPESSTMNREKTFSFAQDAAEVIAALV